MVVDISGDVSAVYGDNVTLFCNAFGSAVTVSWSTTANIFLPDALTISTGKYEYESLLTLTNVSSEAVGVYTCTSENPFESDFDTVTVNVAGLHWG